MVIRENKTLHYDKECLTLFKDSLQNVMLFHEFSQYIYTRLNSG